MNRDEGDCEFQSNQRKVRAQVAKRPKPRGTGSKRSQNHVEHGVKGETSGKKSQDQAEHGLKGDLCARSPALGEVRALQTRTPGREPRVQCPVCACSLPSVDDVINDHLDKCLSRSAPRPPAPPRFEVYASDGGEQKETGAGVKPPATPCASYTARQELAPPFNTAAADEELPQRNTCSTSSRLEVTMQEAEHEGDSEGAIELGTDHPAMHKAGPAGAAGPPELCMSSQRMQLELRGISGAEGFGGVETVVVGRKFQRVSGAAGESVEIAREPENVRDSNALLVLLGCPQDGGGGGSGLSVKGGGSSAHAIEQRAALGHLPAALAAVLSPLLHTQRILVRGVLLEEAAGNATPQALRLECQLASTARSKQEVDEIADAWREVRSAAEASKGSTGGGRQKEQLEHLRRLLQEIQTRDAHLLHPAEVALLDAFHQMPEEAQALFLRLEARRRGWFRTAGLQYAEVPDVEAAVAALQEAGWAATAATEPGDELRARLEVRSPLPLAVCSERTLVPRHRAMQLQCGLINTGKPINAG
ncbi:hypothetical protein CYMTET_8934 [Cymbomonas tetramitiformis]|uniref:Fanconi-associated nuclease n=1 Tax=Cymbomonas tetramitiformis TaxID=36881 RepID=A0AAE0GSG9_9CHLO|nr:hypothetical protein CYMTET_8934 [Cymbomonas tetramitiformis]